MYIIIDGYNLLKIVLATDRITETERSAFVNLMGRYKTKRGHKVTIVFDAGPCTRVLTEKQKGIDVVYSGEYQSADDVIISMVSEYPTKEVLVITADRDIIRNVKGGNTEVLDPQTFYEKIKSVFEPSEKVIKARQKGVIKTTEECNSDLDALMREAAGMVGSPKDEYFDATNRRERTRSSNPSKKVRQKKKKIDKL